MKTDPITQFARDNSISDDMRWKESFNHQVCFVRDKLLKLFYEGFSYEEYLDFMKSSVEINSTHRSKSITLPVYTFKINGFEFTLRDNFHNWKASVEPPDNFYRHSLSPLLLLGISHSNKNIDAVYCEGFPKEKVFGSFQNYIEYGGKGFTIEIIDDYKLYTFFFLFKQYIR